LDEVGTSFGIPEMGQLSLDGEIRRRYWNDPKTILGWAERTESRRLMTLSLMREPRLLSTDKPAVRDLSTPAPTTNHFPKATRGG
jgi:hypothetical protein